MMHNIIKAIYQKIYPYGQSGILFCSRLFAKGKIFYTKNKVAFIKVSIPLLIIGLGYCSCVYSKHVITQNVRMIFRVSESVRQHYADKPSYWGLDTDYVIKQKIVPNSMIKNNQLCLNGGVTILVGAGADGNPVMPMAQSFDVVLSNLNKAQCISYAEEELWDDEKLSLISLSIINRSGTYTFEWGGENSLPIKKYATKQLCQDKGNTLIWSLK